jgi:uncharacterized membrane protein YkvA (DUF1232 family)
LPVIGVLDDAAILWIGMSLFVELAPPPCVKEHTQELSQQPGQQWSDVIDAEATDVND